VQHFLGEEAPEKIQNAPLRQSIPACLVLGEREDQIQLSSPSFFTTSSNGMPGSFSSNRESAMK